MKKRILTLSTALFLLLSACGGERTGSGTSSESSSGQSITESTDAVLVEVTDAFSDRDYEGSYDTSDCTYIRLNGSSADCSSDTVQVSGSTVTITGEGTYILSGTLEYGMIIINAEKEDKIQLVLDGASVHSKTSAALYVLQADKVFVTLEEGTENALSNGGTFTAIDENNIDAVVFSKEDLTLNGAGSLTVTSPAGHGIVSKDELTITGGTYTITSASHGLCGKDSVCIANAALTIDAGKDGIHAENDDDTTLGFVYIASGSFSIAAEGDGITSSAHMQIDDGTFSIVSGGGSANAAQQTSDFWGYFPGMPGQQSSSSSEDSTSIKGIKASGSLLINGGSFCLDSADDTIHSNAALTVCGGTFELSSGDDGFHADEALTFLGGSVNVTESYEALEGLSIDILGGEFVLYASDDGLNAAGGTDQSGFGGMRGNDIFGSSSDSFITISNGILYINAGGDGIDSNGTLTISGGSVTISGANSGDTAILDYGSSGIITGGTFVGTGASTMNVNFSSGTQGSIMVSIGNQSEGTLITLTDANGTVLVTHEADQAFSCISISCPELAEGETYTLTVGSSSYGFTLSSLMYSASSSGGFGGMGNMGGGMGGGNRGGRP